MQAGRLQTHVVTHAVCMPLEACKQYETRVDVKTTQRPTCRYCSTVLEGRAANKTGYTHIHTKKQTYSKNGPWNTPPSTLQVAHARCELDIEVKNLTQALSGMGAGIS